MLKLLDIMKIKAKEFNYKTIRTFNDACKKLKLDSDKLPDVSTVSEKIRKRLIADYKLIIIYEAINNGWTPDWCNYKQWKYYPWFKFLSTEYGFSLKSYSSSTTYACVGSHLCTDTSDKALYIAKQFKAEYMDFLLIPGESFTELSESSGSWIHNAQKRQPVPWEVVH
jgi:hypothetical protein